jgi:uncharacterized protein
MAHYYADTSVLVKQHLQEIGSTWVRNMFDPIQGHVISTARISEVEAVSALARSLREAKITASDFNTLLLHFLSLAQLRYIVVDLDASVITLAQNLLQRHPLRGFDAIHLASALQANVQLVAAGLPALIFLAADHRLLAAAQAEGLATDNPSLYP